MSKTDPSSISLQNALRQGKTLNTTRSSSPGSRGSFPGPNILSKRAIFEGGGKTTANLEKAEPHSRTAVDRLEGEDEFDRVYKSNIELVSRHDKPSSHVSDFVAAINRSVGNKGELEKASLTETGKKQNTTKIASEGMSRPVRIVPDYVSVFVKPSTTEHSKPVLGTAVQLNSDCTVVTRRRSREQPANRSKRSQTPPCQNQQNIEPSKVSTDQNYLPDYIHTISSNATKHQSGTESVPHSEHGKSANFTEEKHLSRVRIRTRRRVSAKLSEKRRRSSSTNDINSTDIRTAEISTNLTPQKSDPLENEFGLPSRIVERRRRHHRRGLEKNRKTTVTNDDVHNDMQNPNQSDQSINQPIDAFPSNQYHSKTIKLKQDAYLNPTNKVNQQHRTRVKGRKHFNVVVKDKYATLPPSFSPSDVLDGYENSNKFVTSRLQQNVVQPNQSTRKANRNGLIITEGQTTAVSEDETKQVNVSQRSNRNQSAEFQVAQHDQSNKDSGIAEGRENITPVRTALLLFPTQPKVTKNFEDYLSPDRCFNPSEVVSRTVRTPNCENVVYSQPMLTARKVSSDYWPRDEATEKLLNRNSAQSAANDQNAAVPLAATSESMSAISRKIAGGRRRSDINTDVTTNEAFLASKETNLNDPSHAVTGENPPSPINSHTAVLLSAASSLNQTENPNETLSLVSPSSSAVTSGVPERVTNADLRDKTERTEKQEELAHANCTHVWRLDEPDKKLKEFEERYISRNSGSEGDLAGDLSVAGSDEPYQFTTNDLTFIPLQKDSSVKGAVLYMSPKPQKKASLATDLSRMHRDSSAERLSHQRRDSVSRSSSTSSCGSGGTPVASTSQKTWVFPRSTPLRQTRNPTDSNIPTESGDSDEGCCMEEPVDISKDFSNVAAFLPSSKMEDDLNTGAVTTTRKRRKYPAAGQNDDMGSSSNGSESSRSRSDPLPDRIKTINDPDVEPGSVDSNLEYALKSGGAREVESRDARNSESDLSCYSETASTHGDDYEDSLPSATQEPDKKVLADIDTSNSSKTMYKKKSLSEPDKNAVLTAGLMSKSDFDGESSSLYNASSEPTLSDQCLEPNQQRDANNPDNSSTESRSRERNGRIGEMTQKLEKMSMSLMELSPKLTTSELFHSTSAIDREGVESRAQDSDDAFESVPESNKHYHHPRTTSETSHSAEAQDEVEQAVTEFTKLYEIISYSGGESPSDLKPPVPPMRSRSDSAVTDTYDNNLHPKPLDRGRRPGIVQAPVLAEVLTKRSADDKSKLSTRPQHSVPRNAATLPRDATRHAYETSKDMRKHVVINLLETERSYVNSLRVLYEIYFTPLKRPESNSICEPGLVDMIFYQIPQIKEIHERFYANVKKRVDNWDPDSAKIGDVFLHSFGKDMLVQIYTSYVNNYPEALQVISTTSETNSPFKQFLEQCQRESKDKQGLKDLMIKPVQRFPRYELIIKDLLKHTPEWHPDRASLLDAKKEIHALTVRINEGERNAEVADRRLRVLQDLEQQLIENCPDISSVPTRRFLHQDLCLELKSGSKKERSLWLFNDLLLCTTAKKGRNSSSLKRGYAHLYSMGPEPVLIDFTYKYKFIWKVQLEDVDLLQGSNGPNHHLEIQQLQMLEADQKCLNQIADLTKSLNCDHTILDEALKSVMRSTNLQIQEQQKQRVQQAYWSSKLEIALPNADGAKSSLYFEYPTEANKVQFEAVFWEAKKAFLTANRGPKYVKAIPISKTRNGMQFACAASNVETCPGTREVWVCNTDGYVGQICFLALEPELAQTQCLTVCSSKITCIAQVPIWERKTAPGPIISTVNDVPKAPPENRPIHRRSSTVSNPAARIIAFDDSDDESDVEQPSPASTMTSLNGSPYSTINGTSPVDLNKFSGADNSVVGGGAFKKDHDGSTLHGSLEDLLNENNNGSMWLGTEEGKIKVFSTVEAIRSSKHFVELSHPAAIQCIQPHDCQVFVTLGNGDLIIYQRNSETGHWEFENKKCIQGTSYNNPIAKMAIVNDGKELWCGCQNQIWILDVKTHKFNGLCNVSQDNKRQICCMVSSGYGVWVALDKRPQIRLIHSKTHSLITEIDVSQPVNKMLAGSDAIIRQHKAACLRITSLLVCNDLLWIGTSAGVVLSLELPNLHETTTALPLPLMPQGLAFGHTGHVRFLASVDTLEDSPTNPCARVSSNDRRTSSVSSVPQRRGNTLVISGGDGYEDFRLSSSAEVPGKDDSTNHLLVWKI